MPNVFQAGHGPAREGLAIHHTGVQLHRPDGVGDAAVPDRIDLGVVLHGLGAGQGRVEGRLAFIQLVPGDFDGHATEFPGGNDNGFRHDLSPG